MNPAWSARWSTVAIRILTATVVALGVSPAEVDAQGALLPGGSAVVNLTGNDFQCWIDNESHICRAQSPTVRGGVWPTGSSNGYLFNSGLMIAGIIGAGGGPWTGDTVGGFFYNASGGTIASPITNVWNSLDADDRASWPDAGDVPQFPFLTAHVANAAVFSDLMIGREAASQQDSWLAYWDGDPDKPGGRPHPAGLMIAQRTLAWNYPAGNEGTIYLVWEITNVSNNAFFQELQEAAFFDGENALPDGGWAFSQLYIAYAADADVTAVASNNNATVALPFDLSIVYDGDFLANEFQYPPSIFHTPFFENAPGIVATQFLRTPNDRGITLYSQYTGGGSFSDPSGSDQLFRYIKGDIRYDLGDESCTFNDPQVRRACFIGNYPTDVRYFQATGPADLQPGESLTVVMAVFAAATVQTNPGGATVTPGAPNPPGAATEPGAIPSLHPGCHADPITNIDRAIGWISTDVCPAQGQKLDMFDVSVVRESLLHKAQIAQTIFDSEFLLPSAPEPPRFYLVPGDDQVTVVWEPSETEESGDPFAVGATDPSSPLYDPSFRQDDIEGYRIYRSSDGINFVLIAQFDRSGTTFVDVACATEPDHLPGDPCTDGPVIDLSGRVVQYPSGGIVELADGSALVVEADTAPAAEYPDLSNTGIPYVFVDTDVRNGFEYFYEVRAFDFNSLASGPSSLESASLPPRGVVPAPLASGIAVDSVQASAGLSIAGQIVAPDALGPSIDMTDGTFDGPPPPTNALTVTTQVFSPALLPSNVTLDLIRIDSVLPGYYAGTYFLTDMVNDRTVEITGSDPSVGDTAGASFTFLLGDDEKRDSLIALGIDAPSGGIAVTVNFRQAEPHFASGQADWAPLQPGFWHTELPADATVGGSRWFAGADEAMADPTVDYLHGQLPGVTTIFSPMPYSGMTLTAEAACASAGADHMRRFYQTTFALHRAADVELRWGAGGVTEVFDVTHQVPVQHKPDVQATYGFLADGNGDGVLAFTDFWYLIGLEATPNIGGCATADPTALLAQPNVMNVDVTGDEVSDGTGFGLYIDGEPYLFLLSGGLPTSGTWTLRTYNGAVVGGPGEYAFEPMLRTPAVPGLVASVELGETETLFAENVDLRDIRVAPDPYYGASLYDLGPAERRLRFFNLPPQASIRIYTVSGILVDVLNHDDPLGGGIATWGLTNYTGLMVASGVYFYHVTTPDGQEHVGRFTVVHSGLSR